MKRDDRDLDKVIPRDLPRLFTRICVDYTPREEGVSYFAFPLAKDNQPRM